jgi:hypothetical protein
VASHAKPLTALIMLTDDTVTPKRALFRLS